MKVLLINPPEDLAKNYGDIRASADLIEPLNLLSLASYIAARGHAAEILDAFVLNMGERAITAHVLRRRPDVVGITATTPLAPAMYRISKDIKERYPAAVIVFGGKHASALPLDCFDKGAPDYVVRGEGEYILSDLLSFLSAKGPGPAGPCAIPGVSYKKNGAIVHNADDTRIVNLDDIPLLDYAMLPLGKYKPKPDLIRRPPVYTVMSARGCPFTCKYCCNNRITNPYREMNIDRLFETLNKLIDTYHAGQIRFVDDNFTLDPERVREVSRRFVKEGLARCVIWSCSSRVDEISRELLLEMKKAGCFLIYFGVETGNQGLLDSMGKRTSAEKARRAVAFLKEAGIESRCSFMLGLPGETAAMTEETINFAMELDPTYATFLLTTPYPGTALFDEEKTKIRSFEWEKYVTVSGFSGFDPVYVPEGRTPGEMKERQKEAFRRFYKRPRQYLAQLKSIRNFGDVVTKMKVFLSLMK
ncbi:MAG: radical SAM protein [Candidatus Omnitrophica bacterium]|nr:radical SAM protein [Candidatus Omnitrophota bacterium]